MNKLKGLHRGIFQYMKKKALSYEGEVSKELKSYRNAQKKLASREFTTSTMKDLMRSIKLSDIVYLGDFHTFDQYGRNFERILRMFSQEDDLILGVEIVNEKHQCFIDHYLSGQITELELLESINYKESWRFPWGQYRNFFLMAKEKGIKILALNSEGNLKQRDKKAAQIITNYYKESHSNKLLILYGEYHIIPTKLPAIVQNQFDKVIGKSVTQTIIHQNLDEVYWRLNDINVEKENQIVHFQDHEYSIQSSAPWIKYESMIYWYEHLSEDPDFDIHEYLMETGMMAFNSSVHENFFYIAQKLSEVLGKPFTQYELESYNLYDHQAIEYIDGKIEEISNKKTKSFFHSMLKRGRSFKIPGQDNFYCSSYSLNRISFLAGVHVFHVNLNENASFNKILLGRSSNALKFIYFTTQFMAGYFSSKVMNPYRKCNLYKDFKEKIKITSQTSAEYIILNKTIKTLDFSDSSKEFIELYSNVDITDIYAVAKRVGFHLSELIYEEFYRKEKKDFLKIKSLLFGDDVTIESYLELKKIVLRDNYQDLKKRYF